MKTFIKEEENEGLEKLLGKRITLFCCRYIYTGDLVGVSDTCVKLSNAGIVFETGAFDKDEWEDMQPLPNDTYIQTSSIESFTILK